MGRLAAHFHLKNCSILAQNGGGLTGICCRDPVEVEHLSDPPTTTRAPGFPRLQRRPTDRGPRLMNRW
jgi:hypothetical protein